MAPWARKRTVELAPANAPHGWRDGLYRRWPSPRNFVVGESHYGDALLALCGPICERGYCVPVEVVLRREPQNPHDPNAIRAEVDGKHVGYLAREIAAQLAQPLEGAEVTSFSVCGVMRGGSTEAPNLGVHVWLDRRISPGPEVRQADSAGGVSWPPRDEEISVPRQGAG